MSIFPTLTFWVEYFIGHLEFRFNIPTDTSSLCSERTTSKVISSLHSNPRENFFFFTEQMVSVSSLTATKTNWGETFNQEHKVNCWSSFKPLKSFNIDSSAEWKQNLAYLLMKMKWLRKGISLKCATWNNRFSQLYKLQIQRGWGRRVHFDYTNSPPHHNEKKPFPLERRGIHL